MIKCDLCDKESVESDSWFLIESCSKHKHVSPVERQRLSIYWLLKHQRGRDDNNKK
jgi:hypothetical protein